MVPHDTMALDIRPHGLFTASLTDVRRAERLSKRELVQIVTDIYAGIDSNAYGKSYWQRQPKAVLMLIAADCGCLPQPL